MKRLVVVIALALPACGAPHDDGPPASAAAADAPAIARVHHARCGACHVRVEPGERTRGELEAAFVRHKRRVHLDDAEWAAMVDYLAAPPRTSAAP